MKSSASGKLAADTLARLQSELDREHDLNNGLLFTLKTIVDRFREALKVAESTLSEADKEWTSNADEVTRECIRRWSREADGNPEKAMLPKPKQMRQEGRLP